MDSVGRKSEQKAREQPKQKKSKSAEFLMEKEEERLEVEGIENPAFHDGREEDEEEGEQEEEECCASVFRGGREMRGDRQDSTLAAHPQQTELRAPAKARGNEHTRNYFDPALAEEGDPRRCRMTGVGMEDELELKFMNEDEKGVYEKLSEMLKEDDATTIIDLPGTVLPTVDAKVPEVRSMARGGWRDGLREERRDELIPHYVEQLKERVQDDVIPLGSVSLEQDGRLQRGMLQKKVEERKQRLMAVLRGKAESHSTWNLDQEELILQDRLYEAFERAEGRLLKALHQRKGELVCQYGELREGPDQSEPLTIEPNSPWQVEWAGAPWRVEVCVLTLRAVRDKLPRGQYCVSVTLHGRLGGPALRWSRLTERRRSGTTEPAAHGGHFYDTELQFNQNLHLVLPAPCDLVPSCVLLFRLLSLPGGPSQRTAVVGWAAFPTCDLSNAPVQGKFKTPLLRGRPDPTLDQFRKIEQLISTDLDNWLCNLYFQVRRLPQGTCRGPEHSVTLQIPPLTQPCPSQGCPLQSAPSPCSSASATVLSPHLATLGKDLPEQKNEKSHPFLATSEPGTQRKGGKQKKPIRKISSSEPCLRESQPSKRRGSPLPGPSDTQLEEYTFSLHRERWCSGGGEGSAGCCGLAERTHLAWRVLQWELGLAGARRAGPLLIITALLALMWFPRLYLHYCSQWICLQALSVPVNKLRFRAHTVELVYQGSLLRAQEEMAMVVLGPLTLNAATLLLLLIRWACQPAFGSAAGLTSKLITAAAVWTVLHPPALCAVDAVLGTLSYRPGEPVADAAKLYWHFYRVEQSGTPGIIITLFLYAVLLILSLTILYVYLVRLHNDGRLLDVYQRLHSPEGAFLIPHDLEVSNQELSYVVKKAEQWRGFNGERRKVAVYDYIWTEEGPAAGAGGPAGGESSTHVSIYTLHLSGLRQRYRHFLRQPDGAIVEVIGEMDWPEPQPSVANQKTKEEEEMERMKPLAPQPLRERRKRKPGWRSHRVEPVGESGFDSSTAPGPPH